MVFKKGHPGYKPKGAKAKTTLLREERRAIFDAQISQKWQETINKLPPTYIADQFLGKPVERHEVVISKELSEEDKALLEKLQNLERDNG